MFDDFVESLYQFFVVVGISCATLCGHLFGGAIVVYFGYHYFDLVEWFVLVSAGGLGWEVHFALWVAALLGVEAVLVFVMMLAMWVLYWRLALWCAFRLTLENLVNLQRVG